jgi:hypothetical protein
VEVLAGIMILFFGTTRIAELTHAPPPLATLAVTLTRVLDTSVEAGTATFPRLSLDRTRVRYTLQASAPDAISHAFDVTR